MIFKFWNFRLLFDSAAFEGGETRIAEYPWTNQGDRKPCY